MAKGFFTNGVAAAVAPLSGTEQLPADTAAGGSESITSEQLRQFAQSGPYVPGVYSAATDTADFVATTGQLAGAQLVVLELTGVLAAGANITTPSATDLEATLPGALVGQSWVVRLVHSGSGAFAWTLVGGTGVTVAGTATVAQGDWREWLVTLTGAAAITMQSIGGGTV